ncbi:SecY-interacting protein [Erwinia sp. OLTSP20]|uniref:SecY-interacting protein n=1 Tax=unclassified Erwinia TaxID=2622719 RepID=UPI000C199C05|nr:MULTISPECIES: SecY-interacting protein [unclassified Erwinia]PIJ49052.1 SecY-interacting protein [Erwinia sp. OAMSP11]PIJ75046.1 SecY-interacting protein [Erwinia sp. OLSSP12]PIJ79737.1 SecY-interacting protein [Erwinia sp. OLCASP19]PIJ80522.1 SecY-interacting protein [Erwinia sp. OLMTSP26]PIJ82637.1 SecY-interacting protein [Erwinia sp. OLMDSP33]
MSEDTTQALKIFTASWCQHWLDTRGHDPLSADLYGIASPCITASCGEQVYWRPQPFQPPADLSAVGRALDILVHPAVNAFYTTQYAGEMSARAGTLNVQLSQVWSPDDFDRTQENLIGHLLMKRRLRQSPTLFIATTDNELDIVSVCNLTGAVFLESLGTRQQQKLAESLADFLSKLQVVI